MTLIILNKVIKICSLITNYVAQKKNIHVKEVAKNVQQKFHMLPHSTKKFDTCLIDFCALIQNFN